MPEETGAVRARRPSTLVEEEPRAVRRVANRHRAVTLGAEDYVRALERAVWRFSDCKPDAIAERDAKGAVPTNVVEPPFFAKPH